MGEKDTRPLREVLSGVLGKIGKKELAPQKELSTSIEPSASKGLQKEKENRLNNLLLNLDSAEPEDLDLLWEHYMGIQKQLKEIEGNFTGVKDASFSGGFGQRYDNLEQEGKKIMGKIQQLEAPDSK